MSSNVKTIIVAIISLLLLVGALGLIIHFTGGGTHDFATFYLTYGNQTIMDTTSGFVLNQFEENRFDVHYTFDESKKNAYDVEIKGNDKYSFTYTVDGEEYEFNGDTDYTGFFDVVEYENFFTVDGLYSIETILIERHNGAEVEIPESVPEHAEFFIMTVKSTTQDSKITIYLKTAPILDEIVLPDEILF